MNKNSSFHKLDSEIPDLPKNDIDKWTYPTGLFDWPKPTALSWGKWEEWDKDMKKRYPFRFFIYETLVDFFKYNIIKNLRDLKWWILHRIHPKHRYHVVKTKLKPGYYDPDVLILESTFALLCDFVDFNTKENIIDWQAEKGHSNAWKEMEELRNWFINIRPHRNEIFDKRPENLVSFRELDEDTPEAKAYSAYLDELHDAEASWEEEDTEMLIRLIKIRKYLWYA